MEIKESGENYLETILMLKNKNGNVRSVDVATELGFSKPSISRAMGILKNAGFIEIEHNGNIILTKDGYKRASAIYDRHITITEFLSQILGVSEENAENDACRIEHVISEETFLKLKNFVEKDAKLNR